MVYTCNYPIPHHITTPTTHAPTKLASQPQPQSNPSQPIGPRTTWYCCWSLWNRYWIFGLLDSDFRPVSTKRIVSWHPPTFNFFFAAPPLKFVKIKRIWEVQNWFIFKMQLKVFNNTSCDFCSQKQNKIWFVNMVKGAFINDVTQIWTVFNPRPLPPLSHPYALVSHFALLPLPLFAWHHLWMIPN